MIELFIKQVIGSELITVTDIDKLNFLSNNIRNLLKEKKEPDLDLKISNLETKDMIILFQKKSATDCLPIKLIFYNTMIKKMKKLSFTSISGTVSTLKDKKIHDLSLTRLGKTRKLQMQEPVETVLIHAQQSFEIAGGLNPVQIELEDDRVLNLLKKHKNPTYKLTPLGILFPASLTNDTRQIFITCRELNDVKKALINGKIYGLLGIIDLKQINDWEEIKGQSV